MSEFVRIQELSMTEIQEMAAAQSAGLSMTRAELAREHRLRADVHVQAGRRIIAREGR